MQVHITARRLELTSALGDYVRKKIEGVSKRFKALVRVQVVLSVEKHRHAAEVVAHAQGHHDFRAKAEAADLYAAVDVVLEKFQKHMARQKDKRMSQRRGRRATPTAPVPVLASIGAGAADGDGTPIRDFRRFTPRDMTPSQAVEELDQRGGDFLVFMNDGEVNVLRKREDKTYSLLEINQ